MGGISILEKKEGIYKGNINGGVFSNTVCMKNKRNHI